MFISPLHSAYYENVNIVNINVDDIIKIATMLINDKRMELNVVDYHGQTALVCALNSKHALKYASVLIENDKFDINICSDTTRE